MSLITRCPACGTMFKVVPDQLRISDGWVRCGHCAEVFDGPANFHDPDAQPAPAESDHPASADLPAPQAPRHEPVHELPQQPATDAPVAPAAFEQVPEPVLEPAQAWDTPLPEPAPEPASPYGQTPDLLLDDSAYGAPSVAGELVDDPPHAVDDEESEEEIARAYAAHTAELAAAAAALAKPPAPVVPPVPEPVAVPTFVRQADRKAFWRRPAVRGVLGLVALALLVSLGLQLAVHERDRIATIWPDARPLLQQMCAALRCEVGALRRIEAVTIDGSSFTRLRADAFRLNITMKNNGTLDVAQPSVELTLTDTQDQNVIRRVLSPADLGAQPTLAAGAEWSGAVTIAVSAAGGASRIAGYRVLAFYP